MPKKVNDAPPPALLMESPSPLSEEVQVLFADDPAILGALHEGLEPAEVTNLAVLNKKLK